MILFVDLHSLQIYVHNRISDIYPMKYLLPLSKIDHNLRLKGFTVDQRMRDRKNISKLCIKYNS